MNNIAKTEINSCAIQKKKQEMINKVLSYQLEKDKAVIYINAFQQMLQDVKNKDFSDDSSEKEITVTKSAKNKGDDFNRQKKGKINN